MFVIAGEWWENVDVWAIIVSSFVGILVGVLGAWAAFRSANPKRRLNWWVRSNTPLIQSLPRMGTNPHPSHELRVSLGGSALTKPRIVELVIVNQGRHDITAGMFAGDLSLKFDFEVPVVAMVHVDATPAGMWPVFAVEPGRPLLELMPTLIKRRQVLTATVIVDGDERDVKIDQEPLVDVDVSNNNPDSSVPDAYRTAYDVFRSLIPIPLPALPRR
ncbi:hypothetical protein ACFYXW_27600 [Streptomyces sp. NPDC001981]|uniref:hypothetical protein n=1 Tax=Streptomyces sp. NPDC001981 TaxID=3364628 RepID=UPI003699D98F